VGVGRVAQAVHLPLLARDRARFELCAVVDPSPALRALVSERYGVEARASLAEMFDDGLDAIVCATPVATHRDVVIAALEAGLHVLCEKPLAFTLEECDEIAAARDRAGRVVQVGYMRQFDPAYRALLERLPLQTHEVRLISAEVVDPTQAPFTAHLYLRQPEDLPLGLQEEIARQERAQIRRATGLELSPSDEAYCAFRHGYTGSIVHDINLIHGMMSRMGHGVPVDVTDSAYWAGGDGVQLAFQLDGGGRVTASYLRHLGVPRYYERLAIVLADRTLELELQSAYLPHRPARLVEHARAPGGGLQSIDLTPSYDDAFELQLAAFHAAAGGAAPVENPPEHARADLQVIREAHGVAVERAGG
jgi:predicted dehydrogenase